MKPNDMILDTDFYQLASDGSTEVELVIPKGTSMKSLEKIEKEFALGETGADFIALIYDFVNKNWAADTTVSISAAGVRFSVELEHKEGNKFSFWVRKDSPAGTTTISEELTFTARVKTFLQPEM